MSITLIIICLVVGLLIGAVGIGGVLLVPALTFAAGIDVHTAIPACMLSFLATGIVGLAIYARHGSVQWRPVGWLCTGAVPAAFLGSLALTSIPSTAILVLIAALMILAGGDALRPSRRQSGGQAVTGAIPFVLIGFVTGFGSAISGTGGPLILVPILIYLGLPVLAAIGMSQAIQIPIAAFASVGNWITGSLDFALAGVIAASMVVGTLAGAQAVHRLPTEPLRRVIAWLLIVVGVGIGLRLLATELPLF